MNALAQLAAAVLNAAATRAGFRFVVSAGQRFDEHVVDLSAAEGICQSNPDWRVVAVVNEDTTVWERA